METGIVTHLCIAPGYGRDVEEVASVVATEGKGLEGDRYFGTTRQVTIVCTGELEQAAAELGMTAIPDGATRRNVTVSLSALPRRHGIRLRIGDAELEVWRDCAPCERMESSVAEGARAALRERAGVSATVVSGGAIRLGDPVTVLD